MKIFGLGMPELIIILVVILIIFGPKNLPKLGASLGKAVKGVREGVDSVNSELEATKESVDSVGKGSKEEADVPVTATAVVEDVPVAEGATPDATAGAQAGGFCSQCGTQLDAGDKFCKKCGAANN